MQFAASVQADTAVKNAPMGRFLLMRYWPMVPLTILMLSGWLTTNHFTPWVSWHSELPFFLAAISAAWVAAVRAWRHPLQSLRVVEIPRIAFALIALLAIVGGQWLYGKISFSGTAAVVALYLCFAVICVTWGATSFSAHGVNNGGAASSLLAETLAWALLANAICQVGIELAQVLRVWESSEWILRSPGIRRPGGNLGQPNHLSTLLIMAIVGVSYLCSLGRLSTMSVGILLAYILLGLAITESRTGLVCVFVIAAWWMCKKSLISPRVHWFKVLPFVVFYLIILALWPSVFKALGGVLYEGSRIAVDGAIGDARMTIWPQLLEASLQKPLWGWGVRNTAAAHSAVLDAYVQSLPLTYSHNLVIDLAIWLGWPLALLVLGASLYWLYTRALLVRSSLSWYGFALLLPLVVHSLLEFPFAYAYLLFPALIGAGLVEANASRLRPIRWPVNGVVVALVLMSAVAVWSVVDYLRMESSFRATRFAMLRIGVLHPPQERPKYVLLTQLEIINRAARGALSPNMSEADIAALRLASEHYPWSGTRYRYATALALNGQVDEAARQLRILRVQHGQKLHDTLRAQVEADIQRLGLVWKLPPS
ncbi:PglL family O-oligosaccharyltransferase [Hydrogenophaga sp. PML113]|uniref:PglL family O-oligosaccharyltransferase n=1 Tax=Hydrogenophaga sp. PML113 TaxID=1899350 RepID=UPI0009F20397|nr:O-antigen ligase family protein [Hydrogenophaga sp. PML113]